MPADQHLREQCNQLLLRVESSPNDARLHFQIGELALRMNDLELAIRSFQKTTLLEPSVEPAHFNLGNAFFRVGRFGEAIHSYQRALNLEASWGTHNNLGNALASAGQLEEAISAFKESLRLVGNHPQGTASIWNNLGEAYSLKGHWTSAEDCFRSALAAVPNHLRSIKNRLRHSLLGSNLSGLPPSIQEGAGEVARDTEYFVLVSQWYARSNQYGKAMATLLDALNNACDEDQIFLQIALLNFARGRRTESLFCFERVREDVARTRSLCSYWVRMLNHRAEISPAEIRMEAVAMTSKHCRPHTHDLSAALADQAKEIGSKRRIGFLIHRETLETNPGIPSLCSALAKRGFDVHVYADIRDMEFSHSHPLVVWHPALHWNDGELASKIRTDEIQLLIDCIGHSLWTRLGVLSRRPSPIQIHWSFPSTTSGLPEMDFILVDHHVLNGRSLENVSEKPLYLDHPAVFLETPIGYESRAAWPDATSFFGCSSAPDKISDEVIEVWSRILLAVDSWKLRFSHPAFQDPSVQLDFQGWFLGNGIESHRLAFETSASVDSPVFGELALDPFPVNDHVSGLYTIAQGIPVVTLMEERLAGRVLGSVLAHLGMERLIARSQEEYVQIAVDLAQQASERAQVGSMLRERWNNSPLCKVDLFASSLEKALHAAWKGANALYREPTPGSKS